MQRCAEDSVHVRVSFVRVLFKQQGQAAGRDDSSIEPRGPLNYAHGKVL